jgi:hypothetical protein
LLFPPSEEQKVLASFIPREFPQEVAQTLLSRLEHAGTPNARVIWREARVKLQDRDHAESKESAPIKTEVHDIQPPALLSSYSSNLSDITVGPTGKLAYPLSFSAGDTNNDFLTKYLAGSNIKPAGLTDVVYQPITTHFVSESGKSPFDIQSPLKDSSLVISRPGESSSGVSSLALSNSFVAPLIADNSKSDASLSNRNMDISGTIVDAETGLPISGAKITLESPLSALPERAENSTDALGHFRLVVEYSSYLFVSAPLKIRITRDGYAPRVKDVPGLAASIPISMSYISLERFSIASH